MRRRHGGRRARVRGLVKVAADFALLAAAVNLARLGVLGVAHRNGAWAARRRLTTGKRRPAGLTGWPRSQPSSGQPGPSPGPGERAGQRPAAVLATYDGAQHTIFGHAKTAD